MNYKLSYHSTRHIQNGLNYSQLFPKAFLLSLVILLPSCAVPVFVEEKPNLIIINRSGEKLLIQVKKCGGDDELYKTVISHLRNNYTVNYLVEEECIDARAVNTEGKITGRQQRLRLPPAVHWAIY